MIRYGWPPFMIWRERKLHRSPRLDLHMRLLESDALFGPAHPNPWDHR